MDKGILEGWTKREAPEEAKKYYDLEENATMRDVILSIRADEAIHRELNHHFSTLPPDADIEGEYVEFKELK